MYAGTLVVRGHGTVEVLATGMQTQFGRIGHALTSLLPEKTPLYLEIHRLIRWVATIGVGVCAIVTVLYALLRDGWLHGALAGITLAMSVLPEEFPVVLTVFMALGAWRLSKRGVLTRRLPAIEALGVRNRARHGQDRHAHRKPHVGCDPRHRQHTRGSR